MDRLQQVDGAAAGAWIGSELRGGFGGRVENQVPQIYEAYARIFHPAADEEGIEVTWGEVAQRLGTTAHREMQWHAIVGTYDYTNFEDSKWPGSPPDRAEMADEQLEALCTLLADHTAAAERCLFGLSTIHGGVEEEFPDAPLLEATHREWVVFAGPLSAFDEIALSNRRSNVIMVASSEELPADYEPPEEFMRQAPNLIWPEDRAWFVATEIDFDSTLIGGSRALIDAILAAPALEAWEVDGKASLTCDADTVNPVPEPPPGWDEPQDPVELGRSFADEWFARLGGEIVSAEIEDGVLKVEVESDRAADWWLQAPNSEFSPAEPAALLGRTVERVELEVETYAIRLTLGDGSALVVTPREPTAEDPPSWRISLLPGLVLTHMHHSPWLFHELPDSVR